MRYLTNSSKRQRGVATIELAIATPFILVMMLLAGEVTRVFYEFNTLTKSVRDGARLASQNAYDSTNQFQLDPQTIANVRNLVVFANINGAGPPILNNLNVGDVTVTQRNLGAAPLIREHIEVTATYNYVSPLSPVISAMGFLAQDFNTAFTLVARSTMRGI